MRFTTRMGCYGCLALWALDIVNPAGIYHELIGKPLERFAERLAELVHNAPGKPQMRILPVYSATGKPERIEMEIPPEPVEYELSDGQTMPIRDLLGFVTTAARTGDWTRSYWCGGDGKRGQGMSQPLWRALRDELRRLKVWEQGLDSPALRAFLHSFEDP